MTEKTQTMTSKFMLNNPGIQLSLVRSSSPKGLLRSEEPQQIESQTQTLVPMKFFR